MPHGRNTELLVMTVTVAATATAGAAMEILDQAGRVQRPPGLETFEGERIRPALPRSSGRPMM